MYSAIRANASDNNNNSIIQQNSILNNLEPKDNEQNNNYNIAYLKNILKNNYIEKLFKSNEIIKIVQLNSIYKLDNSTLYDAKFNINSLNLKNVVKCDVLKAVISKTRQLLNKPVNNNYINDKHTIDYCFSDKTNITIKTTNPTDERLTLNNSNYSVSELEEVIAESTTSLDNAHWVNTKLNIDSTMDIINKDSDTIQGHEFNKSGLSILSTTSAEEGADHTKVITNMTSELAYILGFTKKYFNNPFEKIYAFVNNTTDDYKIKIIYEIADDEDNDTDKIVSGTFTNSTAYDSITKFLNNLNTDKFSLIYEKDNYIINNNSNKKIKKIEILENDIPITGSNNILSKIIGISTTNINKKNRTHSYTGIKKHILEFHENTPNDGTKLTGIYHGLLISKYRIKFIDTHYVNIDISNIGDDQPIILHTSNKNLHISQNVDMNNNYENIIYYRSNDGELDYGRFKSKNLGPILNIKLYDDNGLPYHSNCDWVITLKFTMISNIENESIIY